MVFADTLYWVAFGLKGDSWLEPAREATKALGQFKIVTTDEVLTEFLTALSNQGSLNRREAVRMVRTILSNPNIDVIPQSRASFLEGLKLYEQRWDKEYSLTDCISMETMRTKSLTEVLTNDHHFEQEGFTVLIKK